jgi:hypothetical protein
MFRAGSLQPPKQPPFTASSPLYPTLSFSTTPVTLQQSFSTCPLRLIFFQFCHLLACDTLSCLNFKALIGTCSLRHGPHSLPAPGDLPSHHPRRDVTTRRAHSSAFLKCVHRATITPLSSSLGSYHNVEAACPQFGRTSLPLLRTSGTDLSGSATLRPMGKRTPLQSSQWLCVSGCGDGE